MVKRYNSIAFLILGLLLLPSISALFHPGFFATDDGNWMVIRFSAFYEAFRHGEFPVRFLPRLNHEYGYPVADFLYPGFMYLGTLVHIFGIGFVNTIKIILGFSVVSSGLFSYMWLRKRYQIIPAVVGSLMYVYFPYHLWDVYHRGSVGEVLALAVVPFILWQLELNNKIFAICGIGFLILSHNILALLFLPIIIGYMLFVQKRTIIYIINILLFSLGTSAFFWVPALYDKQFTVFEKVPVSDPLNYFLTDANLLGFGFILTFFTSFWILYKRSDSVLYYFLIVFCISFFFSLPLSGIFWHSGPIATFIQFPFRLLSIAILAGTYLTASVIANLKGKRRIAIAIIMTVLIFYASWKYISPDVYQNYPDTFYSTNEDTTTVKNEYMPKWVKTIPTDNPRAKIEFISGKGELSSIIDKGIKITASANVENNSVLRINKVYFPGWSIKVDGERGNIQYNNPLGVMQIPISQGNHTIIAAFSETPVRFLSDMLSLFSILMLLFYQRLVLLFMPVMRRQRINIV